MFDITPDDISQLNDTDLRELVGRLCEAELVSRGSIACCRDLGRQPDGSGWWSGRARGFITGCIDRRLCPGYFDGVSSQDGGHAEGCHSRRDAAIGHDSPRSPGTRE